MANFAKSIQLRDGDRVTLDSMTRGKDSIASLALRARTVLLAADGARTSTSLSPPASRNQRVRRWRTRYEESSLEGLGDAPCLGKPWKIDALAILAVTLASDGVPRPNWDLPLVGKDHGRTP